MLWLSRLEIGVLLYSSVPSLGDPAWELCRVQTWGSNWLGEQNDEQLVPYTRLAFGYRHPLTNAAGNKLKLAWGLV